MIALLSFTLIGFALFAHSKYWPFGKVEGLARLFNVISAKQILLSSILALSVLYYFQMGLIAAVFLVLFAVSIGLPLVVMMGHHRGTAPVLILLTLAAVGGVL
ncbi:MULTISPECIES: hypothetical protein [Pseudoalteromonas]|uniref:Uncharacterized protein n=1 Tax=Pseudoalteromonas luteoviolacea (strain 2ta16) TaxID=1353533 RepID=V4HVI9_PSEL2|nr:MULTISPECIES: hypothetical protein [Pseudoalteromonas]ESP91969.1 hypothetical protein PL2TA16_05174 [Pseudoalteromonas luteoviolacea 2ta16]KZN33881.1 hypothetical protein N483_25975 [Pseudoalteromonas luteoviolacea NCIMB 1944]MCG7550826.1 hypothetical protein [Pseudoalteromonas sp. Of7M-16]